MLAQPQGLSPLRLLIGTQVQDNLNHFHPFGCPNYFLNEDLCSSQKIHHKWKTRSKVGVYLERYPLHNHDAALVLNHDSSLVIPQFHVRYDPLFTTTKEFDSLSLWQMRAGFFDVRYTPSVALIGQPNMQHFPPITIHKREANFLSWIHRPLVATINKRDTLIHIFLRKRENPAMKIHLNQGEYPNLMYISLKNRQHPMITLPLNKRENPQTLL